MNTEAIRESFEAEHGNSSFDWDSGKNRYKLNYVSYNHDPSEIELEYNSKFELYKDGYQQAVKDMEDSYKHDLTLIINQLRCGITRTSNSSTILQGALSDLIILRGNHE